MQPRIAGVALVAVFLLSPSIAGQRAHVLRDVKVIQVDPTEVTNPQKVKEDFAPNLMQDSLRNALRDSNFEIGESPVHGYISLDEFSSGSTAKRFLVGFGAGRSTVEGRMIFKDEKGEIASVRIRVRGSLLFGSYQGGNTQRRQATTSFEQKLIEEIARLK